MNKENVQDIAEAAEEVVVEAVKAPFKIADRLFGWAIGDED